MQDFPQGSDFSDPSLAIIESLTMAAAYVDASGTIQCVNSAYAQTCGIRRDEFVGRHFEEMLSRWVGNEFYQTAVLSFREALTAVHPPFISKAREMSSAVVCFTRRIRPRLGPFVAPSN
jgi:PAS domain S-box-containing protein